MADSAQSRFQWVLDLFVHAPVGLAVVAVEELPELVARGRERTERQLATARVMGRFAVSQGQREAERLVSSVTGGLRRPSRPAPSQPPPSPASGAAPPSAAPPAPAPSTAAPAAPASPTAGAPPASLAIPGYDALSASQVVQRLPGLTGAELEAVRTYEASNRGRKTILNRVAQLQGGAAG